MWGPLEKLPLPPNSKDIFSFNVCDSYIDYFLKGEIIVIILYKTLSSCISQPRLNKTNLRDFAQQKLFLTLFICPRKAGKGRGWCLLCRITQVPQTMRPPTSKSNIASEWLRPGKREGQKTCERACHCLHAQVTQLIFQN